MKFHGLVLTLGRNVHGVAETHSINRCTSMDLDASGEAGSHPERSNGRCKRHAQPLSNDQTGKGGWKTDSGPGRTEITGKHQIIVKNKERGGRSRASAAKSAGNAKARNTRGGLLVGIFARVSRFRKSNFQLRGHSRQCNTCGTLTINANTTPKTTTTRTGQD